MDYELNTQDSVSATPLSFKIVPHAGEEGREDFVSLDIWTKHVDNYSAMTDLSAADARSLGVRLLLASHDLTDARKDAPLPPIADALHRQAIRACGGEAF